MDDMRAFERQVAGVVQGVVGAPRPFDAMSIARVAATQSPNLRFQTMYGALKFVIAGAIVALFGGFLLSGVLTQPNDEQRPAVGASASATAQAEPTAASTSAPEPTAEAEADSATTISDILPGVDLVTEEVEPGVYRVLSDAVGHDLRAEPPGALIFAPDGDLVLFSGSEGLLDRFYTLGERGEDVLGEDGGDDYWFDAALDDDGNIFARLVSGWESGRLARFDGESWTEPTWPNGSHRVSAVEAAPDGSVWVARSATGPGPRVAQIRDGGWTVHTLPDDGSEGRYLGTPTNLSVAPDGTVWFASNDGSGSPLPKETKGLLRLDGDGWRVPDLPLEVIGKQFGPLAVGPDGTLWVYAADGPFIDVSPYLLRLHEGEWTVFTEDDGVPHLIGAQMFGAQLRVDDEGSLWIAFDGDPNGPRTLPPPLGPSDPPHGVLSFDGSTWRQYLKGQHVNRVEIADDDSVWATSRFVCTDPSQEQCGEPDGLYVITPEAVTTTE